MRRIVFLDSTPLGLLTHPKGGDEHTAISEWALGLYLSGWDLLVPAIIYYEVKRELLRARKIAGLHRLDEFVNAVPGRYLVLTDRALHIAAELWAQSRQRGQPTGDAAALDADVILAAQAITHEPNGVIATSNTKHLAQFYSARLWHDIHPE